MYMKVIGICGGNGVFLHPFKKDLLVNIENRSKLSTSGECQWLSNFEGTPKVKTLEEAKKVLAKVPELGDIDLIIGAPNCGHSSVLSYSKKKSLGDPKQDESLQLFVDGVNYYRPKCFILENVPKFLSSFPMEAIEKAFPG